MDDRLTRYLDGEADASELTPPLREDARRWRAFAEAVREHAGRTAPGGLEERVMREVHAGRAPAAAAADDGAAHPLLRGLRWLFRPVRVALPPAVPVAAAAGLALWLLVGGEGVIEGSGSAERRAADAGSPAAAASSAPSPAERGTGAARVYVEFTLEAPDAGEVAVAGDFTDWAPSVELHDHDGDGVWSGRVPLQPGIHEYMFVVDGQRWVTDPHAERYARDGFGNRNAVLTVALPADASRGGA